MLTPAGLQSYQAAWTLAHLKASLTESQSMRSRVWTFMCLRVSELLNPIMNSTRRFDVCVLRVVFAEWTSISALYVLITHLESTFRSHIHRNYIAIQEQDLLKHCIIISYALEKSKALDSDYALKAYVFKQAIKHLRCWHLCFCAFSKSRASMFCSTLINKFQHQHCAIASGIH